MYELTLLFVKQWLRQYPVKSVTFGKREQGKYCISNAPIAIASSFDASYSRCCIRSSM